MPNNEGNKVIGHFVWPFYKYNVLMPKRVEKDMLEWLYLSLIVLKNRDYNLPKLSYDKKVVAEVRKIIKQKFSSIIDDHILDDIISNTEKDFLIEILNSRNIAVDNQLHENVIPFLETYDELFDANVSNRVMYQDCITGDIVPWFEEVSLYDYDKSQYNDILVIKKQIKDKKEPNINRVKKAFKLYSSLKTPGTDTEEELDDFFNSKDPDEEVDYDPYGDIEFDVKEQILDSHKINKDFNVTYLKDCRIFFELKIDVKLNEENNELEITTPFNRTYTLQWMNKKLKQARTTSEELDNYFKSLEKKYLKKVEQVDLSQFIYEKNIADQLTKCSSLYRIVDSMQPNDMVNQKLIDELKKDVISIDNEFCNKSKYCFTEIGNYLEAIAGIFVDASQINKPRGYSEAVYTASLKQIGMDLHVDMYRVTSTRVYKNWVQGYDGFKANLSEAILQNKLKKSEHIYYDFVTDAFDLYNKRNNIDHYQRQKRKIIFDDSIIAQLEKVTRVFIDMI